MSIGAVTYGTGAFAFLLLTLSLLSSWRGRPEGAFLLTACVVSTIWCAAIAFLTAQGSYQPVVFHGLEILRDAAWFAFLLKVLGYARTETQRISGSFPLLATTVFVLAGATLAVIILFPFLPASAARFTVETDLPTVGHVLMALVGLMLVEQLYRNTPPEPRWGIKFLCLGLGGMFMYDFYMYADALLFRAVDGNLWLARGVIQLIVAPLIMVSAARNPKWSLDVFVSRGVVFHTTTLLGAGIYLLAMAAAGYYIRVYGGSWGKVGQIAFLSAAAILLLMVLFSGQYRARLRVFLSKHFFSYKYDYRNEWLRFIGTLSEVDAETPLRERAIQAVGQIVESPGGALFMRRESGEFAAVASWNYAEIREGTVEPADGPVAGFLCEHDWVINLDEPPETHGNPELPDWLRQARRSWLIVPLLLHDQLRGFMVLVQPRAPLVLNWEDYDLLKTAGRQVASYLAQMEADQALTEARQFEAFHRLSAYVVHDLKNIAGQLSLLTANAAKHKTNPAFVDDAFGTVENAVGRMNRLLTQLRQGKATGAGGKRVDLQDVLERVCAARQNQTPRPIIETVTPGLAVVTDSDRLASVLEHIVQNAQEATPDDGQVRLRLREVQGQAVMEVEDTGVGMDEQFIRERLFRPFDTTKGNAGMGIGVYEAREFVRSMGGEIGVRSQPGEGTTFALRLPLVRQGAVGQGDFQYKEAAN